MKAKWLGSWWQFGLIELILRQNICNGSPLNIYPLPNVDQIQLKWHCFLVDVTINEEHSFAMALLMLLVVDTDRSNSFMNF